MENYQRRFGAPSSENLASHVLIDLGLADSTVRLLAYFLLRPEARPHGRELQRVLGLGGASLSRELRRLAEAGLLLRRQVNPVRHSLGAVAERLGDTSHRGAGFLRSILEGPKRWVAGDARDLRLLATATGLPEIHLGPER
jgi:hypothetical protein